MIKFLALDEKPEISIVDSKCRHVAALRFEFYQYPKAAGSGFAYSVDGAQLAGPFKTLEDAICNARDYGSRDMWETDEY